MKLKLSILLSLFVFIMFSSCEDDETIENSWKLENEAQFAKIASNSEYSKLNSFSGNGFIMYKEIKPGSGDRVPYFTDKVKILYTGWFKQIWTSPDTYKDNLGNVISNKIEFDTTSRTKIARSFILNPKVNLGVIDGLSTALQHMNVGDKWEVWIPYNLGYGERVSTSIPAYTTLVYEVELVEIVD